MTAVRDNSKGSGRATSWMCWLSRALMLPPESIPPGGIVAPRDLAVESLAGATNAAETIPETDSAKMRRRIGSFLVQADMERPSLQRSDRLHASPTRFRGRADVQGSVNLVRCEVTALIVLEAQALQGGYRLDRRVLVANPDSLQRTARGAKLEPCTRGLERPPSERQRPKA